MKETVKTAVTKETVKTAVMTDKITDRKNK